MLYGSPPAARPEPVEGRAAVSANGSELAPLLPIVPAKAEIHPAWREAIRLRKARGPRLRGDNRNDI